MQKLALKQLTAIGEAIRAHDIGQVTNHIAKYLLKNIGNYSSYSSRVT